MTIGVLFDLDGTLLDTLDDLTDATNVTMRRFGKPEQSREKMRKIIGGGAFVQITTALAGNYDDLDLDEVMSFYRAYYHAHSNVKTRPYPGVVDALAELAKKYPVGIVTNKPHYMSRALRDQMFPGVYIQGEESVRPRKPEPAMVKKAMADLGIDACIYVGDTEIDVKTAKNADAPCLCVLWGFRDKEELDAAGGKYYCEDPRKIPEMIEKIIGEVYGE